MPELPTVSVTGTARRQVSPDSFTLTATVHVTAAASSAANETLSRRYEALERAAAMLPGSVEVARGQVSTWQDGNRRWTSDRALEVTGHDITLAAEVAGLLGALEDVAVHGPQWQVDWGNPAHDELQADAVLAARARAQRYAAALGGTLGRLVEISDVGGHGGGWAMQAEAMSAGPGQGLDAMDMRPRDLEINASVTARWYLDLPD